MGIDIHGWIEVSRVDEELRGEDWAWSAIIDISLVVDMADEVSELLFGFSNRRPADEVLAFNKGIPANSSYQVREAIRSIQEMERTRGAGECFGFTSVDVRQLENMNWQAHGVSNPERSDWWTLLSIIRVLRRDERFTNAGLRIVVWACY